MLNRNAGVIFWSLYYVLNSETKNLKTCFISKCKPVVPVDMDWVSRQVSMEKILLEVVMSFLSTNLMLGFCLHPSIDDQDQVRTEMTRVVVRMRSRFGVYI